MDNNRRLRVCPAGLSGGLDNSFRRIFQDPVKILKPFIDEGMTVLDLGCGPGFFTLEIARLVGITGKVIAADLQDGMLEKVHKKIKGTPLEKIIELHKCEEDRVGVSVKADFVLAFWMIHEVPDKNKLFNELSSILKPGGKILIIEPKIHVTRNEFVQMTDMLTAQGFEILKWPKVSLSRALEVRVKG